MKQVEKENNWHLKLFSKSVLKQAKLKNLLKGLGSFENQRCLDLGSDNGVISYKLREIGGSWASGDLTEEVVSSIEGLVKEDVHLVSGDNLPFESTSFDKVVVVDMLEHVEDDKKFVDELARILKPEGQLIINAPNLKPGSLLRMFRHLIGQTDEAHGHLRPGYAKPELYQLTKEKFEFQSTWTYSKFFSEAVDTAIVFAYETLKKFKSGGEKKEDSEVSKGLVVTEEGMKTFQKQFKLYSLIYPVFLICSKLDYLVPFSGYMRLSSFKRLSS